MHGIFVSSLSLTVVAAWWSLVNTFIKPCRLRVWAKRALAAFFFASLAMFGGFALFGESMWRPELPERLIWIWGVCFFGTLLLSLASALGVGWKSSWKHLILAAICFGTAARGVWNGVKIPGVVEIEIRDENLPAELDGYRIVQISDIHACGAARRWRTEKIVEIANALDADLICLTGDQTDGTVARRFHDIEPIKDLKAKDGVFAITGNHEYFYDVDEWRPVYDGFGIRLLENECAFPRKSLALGGVTPWNAPVQSNTETAFAAATNGEYRVLLKHMPRSVAESFEIHGVNFQLSGHLHGGFMPLLDSFVERRHDGFLRGVYEIGEGHLVISPGCGPWPALPIRYFDPARILAVTLRRPGK